MMILSHRGYWKSPEEKNREVAFRRSFERGFGTETDFRDLAGQVVIAHDPPRGGEMSAAACFALMADRSLPMALNVKADGLAEPLGALARGAGLSNWFVFDMSVPDTIMQLRAGNPVFARLSEYEADGPLVARCPGVWLDGFDGIWFDRGLIDSVLSRGQKLCIVSPELHQRDQRDLWEMLLPLRGRAGLMLCTDLPEDAQAMLGDPP